MPPEHEAPVRAFYDHEDDEPRGGRRRRVVADWGVSEDVFDRMPSRRFSRRGEEPRDVPRRGEEEHIARTGDEPRRHVERAGEEPRRHVERTGEEPRRHVEEPRRRAERTGEEPRFARYDDEEPRRPAPVSRTIVIEREPELDPFLDEEAADEATYEEPRVTSDGRRTVVIGGRPDRLPVARTRPPRSALDRIGPSPDRIVGYAVALGALLILIAILSSH